MESLLDCPTRCPVVQAPRVDARREPPARNESIFLETLLSPPQESMEEPISSLAMSGPSQENSALSATHSNQPLEPSYEDKKRSRLSLGQSPEQAHRDRLVVQASPDCGLSMLHADKLSRMSDWELNRALKKQRMSVSDDTPVEIIDMLFRDMIAQQEQVEIANLASRAGVDVGQVKKCWICGRLTASPILLNDPECPHRVCSLQCLNDAEPKWIGIVHELRELDVWTDTQIRLVSSSAKLQSVDVGLYEDEHRSTCMQDTSHPHKMNRPSWELP